MTALGVADALEAVGAIRVLAEPLDHPEGVAVGPDRAVWAGGEAGQLYRVDPADGAVEQVAQLDGWLLGLCVDASGRIYACADHRVWRHDPRDGTTDEYCAAGAGRRNALANFPVFDADGTLYVSDSGAEDPGVPEGRILVVPPGGGDAEVLDLPPLAFANGLALDPDGVLYVAESHIGRISRVVDGALEEVVRLPGTFPDGLALDAEGGLLVSCFQPNLILRIDLATGVRTTVASDWSGMSLLSPTNVAFHGPEQRRLLVATICGVVLREIELPWRGQTLHYPG